MRATLRIGLFAATLSAVAACDQQHPRFRPGDHVTRKLTGTDGVVVLRLRPFVDDMYYVRFRGPAGDEWDQRLYEYFAGHKPTSHMLGPFYNDDLAMAR